MTSIRPHSTRILASLTLIPLALSMSACSIGFKGPDSTDTNTSSSGSAQSDSSSPKDSGDKDSGVKDSDKDAGASPSDNNGRVDASQVIASHEAVLNDHKFRVDLNAIIVKDGVTTVTMTVTNADASEVKNWPFNHFGLGRSLLSERGIRLVDNENKLIYIPGTFGDVPFQCLCTDLDAPSPAADLKAGESQVVYTTFDALPENTSKVTVDFMPISAPFENAEVTRK